MRNQYVLVLVEVFLGHILNCAYSKFKLLGKISVFTIFT